ncbi:hypothetical protein QPC82_003915 [Escherichia coli]|nr:hypothetical protein [Escherichia coli]
MNIKSITNAKENTKSIVKVNFTSFGDDNFTTTFKFNDRIVDECKYTQLFSIENPRAKQSEEVIAEIMNHRILLTHEEFSMINGFINKTGDRLVYSIVGYDLSAYEDEEKRGVAMIVISRGGIATVFTFGHTVFTSKKKGNNYVDRAHSDHYTRYFLSLTPEAVNPYRDEIMESVSLEDVKLGSFEIVPAYGKNVFQYYLTKSKLPSNLELHDAHYVKYNEIQADIKAKEKAEQEERDRPRKEAETYAKLISGRLSCMKNKVKTANTWEDAVKFYHQANILLVELEEARDLWASLDKKYAQRRSPATLQPIDELCKLPKPEIKHEIKKARPTLRLVA